ncbi:tetratricopeptide repeat protein [Rheinheimera aquimaris]|jgi:tetratricopeptide (TPR) repeat protein|uniref:tetratricopeptide repeat protein n=5 Tax=Rheinheimera TaxID=67575 RepID=UPI001065DA77|nr:tetratricopeptide repeat protein [Rheinheimera aquimaris]MCD1600370.1 tetratricopeptide repeat protein [Rheinheimera aquimaris]|tara:strand:+ start:751 stop:1863 length:1113 start_codon:yes stop_codon:yes gene_type:complete
MPDINFLFNCWLKDPENENIFSDILRTLLSERKFEDVLVVFADASAYLQNKFFFSKIDALLSLKRYSEASVEIDKLSDNSSLKSYYSAVLLYLGGQAESAMNALNKAAEQAQLEDKGHLLKARLHYIKSEMKPALSCLEKISDSSRDAEYFGLSALLALDLGNIKLAKSSAEKSLKLSQNQFDALLALASIFVSELELSQASVIIEKCLTLQPKSGRSWSVKGQVSLFNRLYDIAEQDFRSALIYMPDHIGTWHLLAWNYYLLGRLDQAEEAFKHALALDNAFGESYGGLAVIAAVKGRIDECNHYIKLAFKLNKRSFSAEYAKALVEQSEGNTNGAENRVKGLLAQSSHLSDFTYAQLVARVVESVGND